MHVSRINNFFGKLSWAFNLHDFPCVMRCLSHRYLSSREETESMIGVVSKAIFMNLFNTNRDHYKVTFRPGWCFIKAYKIIVTRRRFKNEIKACVFDGQFRSQQNGSYMLSKNKFCHKSTDFIFFIVCDRKFQGENLE